MPPSCFLIREIMPRSDEETIDELKGYGLKIAQPRHGYRYSLDPLLLCDFTEIGEGDEAIDLGTGSGLIPLILARKADGAHITGVELQEGMAELARRNAEMNGLSDRVSIIHQDILGLKGHFPVSSFDLVVANPPYRKRGTGRVSPKAGRDRSRHESTAGLSDFLAVAKYLVRPGGRICFVYLAGRLAEFMAEAAGMKLSPLRLRMVHGDKSAEARMFLVELAKGSKGGLKVLPPLFVHDGETSEGNGPVQVSPDGEMTCGKG